MSEHWHISDTHFGHVNMMKFTNHDGSPVRDFESVEEMDQTMIDNWNRTVGPKDIIYHHGDVVINRRFIQQLGRLNGRKRLIGGNHDIFKLKDWIDHFEDIKGVAVWKSKKGAIVVGTHVPIHPDCMEYRWTMNAHGHLHGNRIKKRDKSPDPRYFNLSVECIDYTPVHQDVLLEAAEKLL